MLALIRYDFWVIWRAWDEPNPASHYPWSVYEPDPVSSYVYTEPDAPRFTLIKDCCVRGWTILVSVIYEPAISSLNVTTTLIWLEVCIYDNLLLPRHFHARLKHRVIHPYRAWRELESLIPNHTPTSSQIVTRGNHWSSLVSLRKWVLQ